MIAIKAGILYCCHNKIIYGVMFSYLFLFLLGYHYYQSVRKLNYNNLDLIPLLSIVIIIVISIFAWRNKNVKI